MLKTVVKNTDNNLRSRRDFWPECFVLVAESRGREENGRTPARNSHQQALLASCSRLVRERCENALNPFLGNWSLVLLGFIRFDQFLKTECSFSSWVYLPDSNEKQILYLQSQGWLRTRYFVAFISVDNSTSPIVCSIRDQEIIPHSVWLLINRRFRVLFYGDDAMKENAWTQFELILTDINRFCSFIQCIDKFHGLKDNFKQGKTWK